VATRLDCDREDDGPASRRNAPLKRNERKAEYDYRGESEEGYDVGRPEALEDGWGFLEEMGELDLLLGRTPCDVIGEQMRENGTREVETQAAEEEKAARGYEETMAARVRWHSQEGYPLNVNPEGLQKALLV